LARDLAREPQDPLRREGLSGTSLNGVLCCFVVCCCTPQGREKPTGTGAPSYGSEGWGFESLRARKSAGHRLADERLIFGFSKFGTQVVPDVGILTVGILTRPEARFPLQRSLPLRPPVAYARAGLGVAVAANWASLRMRDATTEEGCRPSRYDQNLAHDGSATCVDVKALGRFGDRTANPLSHFG